MGKSNDVDVIDSNSPMPPPLDIFSHDRVVKAIDAIHGRAWKEGYRYGLNENLRRSAVLPWIGVITAAVLGFLTGAWWHM